MTKKNIFISARSMEVGGIERSLLGLLNALDYDQYEVDLFLWTHTGPFMGMIPSRVNLLPEVKSYALMDKPITRMLLRGCLLLGLVRVGLRFYTAIRGVLGFKVKDTLAWYYHEYSLPFLPRISSKQYCLAISFQGPTTFLDKVNADQKIGWIHTDYSYLELDVPFMEKIWSRADKIVAVSESCRDVFVGIFPRLTDRLIVIENILSPEFVRQQGQVDISAEMSEETNIAQLCTVGRYSHPKAFDRAVLICKKMVELGCSVRWYAVGPENNHPILTKLIREAGMESYFILLGEKVNPYPYMAACDVYVQPSRFEGKAVTVREAQMLGKPVAITNFATASSQLKDGFDGVIIPMEIDDCARDLKDFIENMEKRKKLCRNTLSFDYGNEGEVRKIEELIPRTN